MGIYPNRGVEYHVVLRNGRRLQVASTARTDERLLQSSYFAARKDGWFDNAHHAWCKPVADADFDIELTQTEQARLRRLREENGEAVASHGWFDVCTISDTYGPNTSGPGTLDGSGYFVSMTDGSKIKVCDREVLSSRDQELLRSIMNVHGDRVASHGFA